MKAKHAVARIKGLSVWQKIFCTLLAVTLLCLMVPNGLRANADNSVAEQSNGNVGSQQVEVKTQTEQETLDAFKAKYAESQAAVNGEAGWWTLNSDVTFVPSSYNAEETAGHFMEQKAQLPILDYFKYTREGLPKDINELKDMLEKNFGLIRTWILGFLAGYEEVETTGNVFEDLSDALIIPEDRNVYTDGVPGSGFNTFDILLENGKINFPSFPPDGSIIFTTITLGEGNSIEDIIYNTSVNATRVIPIIPAQPPVHFSNDSGLLGSELSVPENAQAYFSDWSISFDGANYIPLTWIMDMIESNSLPILPYTHYFFKANFWDVKDMVPVHLDFNGAYVAPDFANTLRSEGWYTTDFINGSVWTKAYFDWMPTWYVYSDIFDNFGEYIFGDTDDPNHVTNVYKDDYLKYFSSIYCGPRWFETDNENYWGTLDKETTLSFSVYAVSPRGHVLHSRNNIPSPGNPTTMSDYVDNAYVMFYNEWGWPLFDFDDFRYEAKVISLEPQFFFEDEPSSPDHPYCLDTEIDYAVVYASSNRPGEIYLPLWVDMKNFNYTAAGLFDEGLLDFQVERMMYADLNTFMSQDSISSIEVSYFQDGVQLFDTYTATDPWAMAMLSVPMVTNGTITTGDNRLVTGFASNIDFVRPFGEVDMLNAFDANNFEASETSHWYQCQIKVNPKPGYTFNTWTYDFMPISADTYKDEAEIIIREPLFLPNHTIGMQFNKPAAAEVDNDVIYGDAAGTAIYGETVAPAADVVLASDGAATTTNTGTAQTGDSMGFAFAILAMLAIAGAGVLAGRKLYVK